MTNEIAISIKKLSKTFHIQENRKYTLRSLFISFFNQGKTKEFKALDNINIDIFKGEFLGIIGRNGGGKSTLLKLIAGIYDPDEGGKIDYVGRLIPFLELGIGFNPDLSGRENIYLNGTIIGMSKRFLDEKFNDIVNFSELNEFINVPVKNYSSGMMIRLAFSIAIQSDANIYLLDEILSVGDENFQKKSQIVINRFKEEGKTILFVSHNMSAIEQYCDRVALIHNHKLEFLGDPKEAIERYHAIN